MSTVLITGVAGFIGSHLAEALLARGDRVHGFDNLATGKRESVPEGVEFVEGDLADAEGVSRACAGGVDAILHQGALPSVPRSVVDPRSSHRANIEGTFNLLEGARAAGVQRVVYAASSSAYGDQPGFPRVETMRAEPISPYAVQKLTGELYMQSYARVYGMETVSLRYFNIFGPRQAPDSPYSGVVARWCHEMLAGVRPVIQGGGTQGRDFTYVENAVHANLLALEAPAVQVAGRVFNVACGERSTVTELYGVLARLTGFVGEPVHEAGRAGDVRDSLADISAARGALGYEPRVGLEEGLRRTVDWMRHSGQRDPVRLRS